jgi:integrase
MASLRTRKRADGSTSWSVVYRHGGRQRSTTFDTEHHAHRFMADADKYGVDVALEILAKHQQADAAGSTIRTVADQCAAHTAALSGVTIGTRRKYERLTRLIGTTPLGAMPLDTVTREDVARWIRNQETSGLSGKTIRDRQSFLSAAFVRAVDDELMTRNPARAAKIGKTERREPVFLTPPEFRAILNAAPPDWHPFLITLAGTGLRFGEATALQVGDVDLHRDPPTIRVARGWVFTAGAGNLLGAPKTANGRRTIGIGADVAGALEPLVAGRQPDAWLFTADGDVVRPTRAGDLWRSWVKASGITKTPRLHDLRHTHASWMMARNYPLNDLSRRLGHASIKVTADTYGHLAHDAQTRAAALAYMGLDAPAAIEPPAYT